MPATDEEWIALWRGIGDLVAEFSDRLVFIGGVAVYLHVSHVHPPEGFIEFSHDGDFFISFADFGELRDIEEVTPNKRLAKSQLIKYGVEFDIYVEYRSRLLIPFAEALDASVVLDAPVIGEAVRVASPEHLLVLKLDAYNDRKGSRKGEKDERDLVRIAYVLDHAKKIRMELLEPYLTDTLLGSLKSMKKSSAFLQLSGGNAHQARRLREMFANIVDQIDGAVS